MPIVLTVAMCMNSAVFLDLKKAFNTMDHKVLLSKLHAYGFRGAAGNRYESYLSGRNQQCSVNGHLSNSRSLICGIPQGTILGPLLFLVYINDLPNCLAHAEPCMYADDTHLTFASNNMKDIELYLNQDLANVNQWLIANKLTLSQSMSLCSLDLGLCTFQSAPNLTINGTPIKQVSQAKSLGVYVDENLSWTTHTNEITKKIASGIGALKRVRPFVRVNTLMTIFNSLVQPHFNYCYEIWDTVAVAKPLRPSYKSFKIEKLGF